MSAPQPTVSHHLAALRTHRLVHPRRHGKRVYYSLGDAVTGDGATLVVTLGSLSVTLEARGPCAEPAESPPLPAAGV